LVTKAQKLHQGKRSIGGGHFVAKIGLTDIAHKGSFVH
jgi:hypothetical protein